MLFCSGKAEVAGSSPAPGAFLCDGSSVGRVTNFSKCVAKATLTAEFIYMS